MFKLMKLGGIVFGSSTILGILNGKFNKQKTVFPKFSEKEFEEIIQKFNQSEQSEPKFQIPRHAREENIKRLSSEQFDILIIGGGATGAGVLLNLYNKGVKCALIESKDFASGTSSRSTKLAHGGIRYLQEVFEFKRDAYEKYKLVIEALTERDFFVNSAPHLNEIVEIKIPLSSLFNTVYYFSGCLLYHVLYFMKSYPNVFYVFPGPKIYLNDTETKITDNKNSYSLSQNFKYFVSLHEGQMFDSRQNLLSLLTTTIDNYSENCSSSVVSNYTEFQEFLLNENKKIVGVVAIDKITNKKLNIKAKTVINCAGIFADKLFNKEDPQYNKLITASKGTHVIMKSNIFNIEGGLMIPKTSDGRVLFILPYQGHYLIGTTDETSEKTDQTCPNEQELNYIIKELKDYFKIDEKIIRENITSSWSGLRPLFGETDLDNHESKSISRGHIIKRKENGLVSVLGGKWTTYRKIGQDVVEFLGKEEIIEKNTGGNSLTMKLIGSYHPFNLERNYTYQEERQILENLKNYIQLKYLIDRQTVEKLVFYYGFNAIKVLELGHINNTNVRIHESLPVLESQIIYSVRHEMSVKPNDIICRRIGVGFLDDKLAHTLVEKVTQVMGKELKWSNSKIKTEIEQARKNLSYLI